ncbi:MAG: hypothetical protein SH807_05065 [Blastochloris sp.]|nr:hypothetical protein [Blastochloris sp.]
MTALEFKRLFSEWRVKLQRVQHILQPPTWTQEEWTEFARILASMIRKYGANWQHENKEFWDIRWDLQEGGQLACQLEAVQGEKLSMVVAQYGGFADGKENYIWFYCDFNESGQFRGEPFWVEGNWKDALAMILMPHKMSTGCYLSNGTNNQLTQHLLAQTSGT